MTFGQKIKKLRGKANYTQAQLGELLSVSTQAVSRWETDVAMPDISLLAPLANLFNVTTDYLLDVDIEKKTERIDAIIRKANEEMCRHQNDRWNNAVQVLQEGLRLYPDSWDLKNMLATFLPYCLGNEEEKKRYREEANKIWEDIVANCPNKPFQYQAIHQISRWAGALDNHERALELARTLPLLHQSRDFLELDNLQGDAQIRRRKEVMYNLYIHLVDLLYGYAGMSHTQEEVGALYEKARTIREVLYENDDFIKSGILGDSTVEWAGHFARVGDLDMAFRLLNEDMDRILDITDRKLHRFSILSPPHLTEQVEAADIAARKDDLQFRVEDNLDYLDKYFPEDLQMDERYGALKERYRQYIGPETEAENESDPR